MQAILGKPDEPTDLPRPVGPPGEPNIVVNNKLGPIGMPGSARLLGFPEPKSADNELKMDHIHIMSTNKIEKKVIILVHPFNHHYFPGRKSGNPWI